MEEEGGWVEEEGGQVEEEGLRSDGGGEGLLAPARAKPGGQAGRGLGLCQ